MDVDAFAPRLSFFFNSHIDFFEEIAKFRAARRIYARRMREKYGAKNPKSWQLRFHTQTAGCSATAQQPENNIVRVAYEAMAAVLGGTQSLHTNSMDEVLALPTEKSVEIALRTQQVLAYETNVTNVVDPLGGSYFVEALTDEMERQAEAYFAQIEEYGGVIEAIEAGFFQKEIAEASYRYQRSIEVERSRHRRASTTFERDDERVDIDLLKISEEIEREQARYAARAARDRDGNAVATTLERLQQACRDRARQPDAAPHRLRQRLLHRRRNRRSDGRRLRALHGAIGLLDDANATTISSATACAARSPKSSDKLEEALRLSKRTQQKGKHGEPTTTNRRR